MVDDLGKWLNKVVFPTEERISIWIFFIQWTDSFLFFPWRQKLLIIIIRFFEVNQTQKPHCCSRKVDLRSKVFFLFFFFSFLTRCNPIGRHGSELTPSVEEQGMYPPLQSRHGRDLDILVGGWMGFQIKCKCLTRPRRTLMILTHRGSRPLNTSCLCTAALRQTEPPDYESGDVWSLVAAFWHIYWTKVIYFFIISIFAYVCLNVFILLNKSHLTFVLNFVLSLSSWFHL